MRFNTGDKVIKTSGGNKMIVTRIIENSKIYCTWFVDKVYDGFFDENELVTINEYQSLLVKEERDDKINRVIS